MPDTARQPTASPVVAVLAALDTKSEEAAYLCEELRRAGCRPVLVDFGVLGDPPLAADVTRVEVAEAAGTGLAVLQQARDAGRAGATMAQGLTRVLRRLYDDGEIAAVIAIGGSKGTSIACDALRSLPFGFPKVMVTPAASGNTRRFVGATDIWLVPTVADLLGLNRITRPILANAASAVAALACRGQSGAERGRTVAISSFGVTTPCVERVRQGLLAAEWEVVVFPASGIGGEAMEGLVLAGEIQGVIDLTTTELADELAGGTCSAGPHRLEAAGRMGIPQVVSLGALDMVNFGPAATVPAAFAERKLYRHSSAVTLMRTTAKENQRLGEILAEKLNRSTGPCAVVIPAGGFSDYDRPGGPFFDPEADRACIDALQAQLSSRIPVVVSDAHINDPRFAQLLIDTFRDLVGPDVVGAGTSADVVPNPATAF